MIFGSCGHAPTGIDEPSGYTQRHETLQNNRNQASATKEIASAGTETPGDWTLAGWSGAEESQCYTLAIKPAGGSTYSLTMSHGTLALSGQALAFVRDLILSLAQGAYTLTGQAVGLLYGADYILTAAHGAYALTGQALSILRQFTLTAAHGLYALTGQAISATYSEDVQPTPAARTFVVPAETRTFVVPAETRTYLVEEN